MGEPVCLRIDAEGIAHLQLLDDDAGNLLSPAFVAAFGGALDQLQTDGHIRVCVLSGGSEVFCGGADRETLLRVCDGATSVSELQLPERLLDTPVPIIAAMEGHAVGGGLALAAACD
ncbi:MAG: enoyl-CoA hydratase, partial [Gemmatimonadaceae bacterium]|nr:enoyl-CoA hydratase [Gemmatimonadaceae bacterium]